MVIFKIINRLNILRDQTWKIYQLALITRWTLIQKHFYTTSSVHDNQCVQGES